MAAASGSLSKLVIEAYADKTYRSLVDSYTLQINPDSYKRSHSTSYAKDKTQEKPGQTTKFSAIAPQTVDFEFYLDYTGVVPPAPGVPALPQAIVRFKKCVYDYNGKIHSPNYLRLRWTDLQFKCRLTSLNIDYTLFKPNGTPLRAKLSVSFEEYLREGEGTDKDKPNSPDLSHVRVVQAGDTLPLLCHEVYGASRHYIAVARFNRLSQFRQLEPGTALCFPPLGGD